MLALVSHEPHFCLLREVVSFGGANRGRPSREVLENPCAEHFVLLQVGCAPRPAALRRAGGHGARGAAAPAPLAWSP